MPCRTPLSTAQALWITDDLLAEAYHRFARLSHTFKRHGSNVPGPLEARRKLAKRRMGMAAVTSTGSPPAGGGGGGGGDFGALFGLGGEHSRGVDFEKGWRWEAPCVEPLSQRKESRGGDWRPWMNTRRSTNESPWQFEPDVEIERKKRVETFLSVPQEDPIEASRTRLEALLASLRDKTALNEDDTEPLLTFIESSSNSLGPKAFLPVIQSVPLLTHVDFWKRIADSLRQRKRTAEFSSEDLIPIFTNLLERKDGWESIVHIFLVRLQSVADDALPVITEHILTSTNDEDERKGKIIAWLQCIPSQRGHVHTRAWKNIYSVLSQHLRPSDLAQHFGAMQRDEFAWALLQHWVPGLAVEDGTTSENSGQLTTIDHIDFKDIRFQSETIEPTKWNAIIERFRTQQASLPNEDKKKKNSALIELVTILADHKVPYTKLLVEIFTVYTETSPANTVKNLFMHLRSRKYQGVGIPTPLAAQLVQHFLGTGDLAFAFYVFRSVPTLPLLQCFDLPIKLIEAGRTHGGKIFELLNRQAPEDTVVLEFRSQPRLALKQQHIDLVHLAAYAFASSTHVSARAAFRRVWECYRFLVDRRAPLTPLMSRALVKAGIARPLKEKRWLSAEQVRFVISVVQRVEGEDVAKEVDELVHAYWQRVLRERFRSGESEGVRKEELQGKWYHGKRRLWMKGGGRVYLPPSETAEEAQSESHERGEESPVESEEPVNVESSEMEMDESSFFTTHTNIGTESEPGTLAETSISDGVYMPFATQSSISSSTPAPATELATESPSDGEVMRSSLNTVPYEYDELNDTLDKTQFSADGSTTNSADMLNGYLTPEKEEEENDAQIEVEILTSMHQSHDSGSKGGKEEGEGEEEGEGLRHKRLALNHLLYKHLPLNQLQQKHLTPNKELLHKRLDLIPASSRGDYCFTRPSAVFSQYIGTWQKNWKPGKGFGSSEVEGSGESTAMKRVEPFVWKRVTLADFEGAPDASKLAAES